MESPVRQPSGKKGGFTLVEVLMVIGIITLLASIAIPSYQRSRRRAQASRVLEDLRTIDSAMDQYATEFNKPGGASVVFTDLQKYLKPNSQLYVNGADVFGNPYGPFSVDTLPLINSTTYNALSDVADASFWSPFHD
jgi:prepilin-type N-terminal cleavage/methylation domain-containing protein